MWDTPGDRQIGKGGGGGGQIIDMHCTWKREKLELSGSVGGKRSVYNYGVRYICRLIQRGKP